MKKRINRHSLFGVNFIKILEDVGLRSYHHMEYLSYEKDYSLCAGYLKRLTAFLGSTEIMFVDTFDFG